MIMIRALLSLLLLAIALPAQAGIVATYRAERNGLELTFEVGDNGDFRTGMKGQSRYLLGIGDVTYIVAGDRATRVSDYGIWMRERGPAAPEQEPVPFGIIQDGTVTVRGRTGRAYFPDFGDGPMRQRLVWVISDDPALRPLGAAFTRHWYAGLEMGESLIPYSAEAMKPLVAPMMTGTPLIAFIQLELVSLEFRAIAPDRLKLPATIETLEQLRARLG